jgi:hypothetical protein
LDRAVRGRAMPSRIETGWELDLASVLAPVSLADVKSASVRST